MLAELIHLSGKQQHLLNSAANQEVSCAVSAIFPLVRFEERECKRYVGFYVVRTY